MKPKKIALFCSGSPLSSQDQVLLVVQKLAAMGIDSVYGPETYQAIDAKTRAEIFLAYCLDESISDCWALRGGEGSADLIPFLEQSSDKLSQAQAKPIMGFSDITAILIYFAQQYAWPVVHGPGALSWAKEAICPLSLTQVERWLLAKPIAPMPIKPLNLLAQKTECIYAKLIGGNLSLINISIQDCWEIDTANKIVILEDVNEKAHAVDRTLKYLARIGKLDLAAAVILSRFNQTADPQLEPTILAKLVSFAQTCSCPVFITDFFGHDKHNYPLSFKTLAKIDGQNHLLIFE